MADIQETPKLQIEELEKTFEEYKSKLALAEQESEEILTRALRKAESIITEGQEKSQKIADEITRKSIEEADKMILEAKNKAEQVVIEANDRIKKEAKDRTKREVERIIADARQVAEKESSIIIVQSRKEAGQLVNEIKEIARAEAQKESSEIVTEAEEMAKKFKEDSIVRVTETNKLLSEVVEKIEGILDRSRTQVQAELTGLLLDVTKAKDNLENRSVIDEIDKIGANKANSKAEENRSLVGQRKLKIILPGDHMQIERLKAFLKQVPNIKLVGEAATEDHVYIYIDIVEPLPLINILTEMPLVASSDVHGDTIKLSLKSNGNIS